MRGFLDELRVRREARNRPGGRGSSRRSAGLFFSTASAPDDPAPSH